MPTKKDNRSNFLDMINKGGDAAPAEEMPEETPEEPPMETPAEEPAPEETAPESNIKMKDINAAIKTFKDAAKSGDVQTALSDLIDSLSGMLETSSTKELSGEEAPLNTPPVGSIM